MPLQRVRVIQRFLAKPIFTTLRQQNRYGSASSNNPSISPTRWDLFAAICLQRCPLIAPELNWLEKRVQDILNQVEFANSLYSDHEMRHFEDLRRAERIASGVQVDEKDLEEAAKQTAQDFEETSIKEMKEFQFGSSITKADLLNNEKSIDRFLDKHLYLTVKMKLGPKEYWLFPQELYKINSDESLKNTAERALEKCFPSKEKSPIVFVKFIGNCPSALYSYRYPKQVAQRLQKSGARIFLFKCEIDANKERHPGIEGDLFGDRILKPANYLDYAWLTRNELQQQMPQKYWKKFGPAIYPDELVNIEQLMASSKQNKIIKMTKRLEKIESLNS